MPEKKTEDTEYYPGYDFGCCAVVDWKKWHLVLPGVCRWIRRMRFAGWSVLKYKNSVWFCQGFSLSLRFFLPGVAFFPSLAPLKNSFVVNADRLNVNDSNISSWLTGGGAGGGLSTIFGAYMIINWDFRVKTLKSTSRARMRNITRTHAFDVSVGLDAGVS